MEDEEKDDDLESSACKRTPRDGVRSQMIHLLRQDDVTEATANHEDTLSVPEANQRHLRELGAPRLRQMVERCTHAPTRIE